jgi:hypothetical protein
VLNESDTAQSLRVVGEEETADRFQHCGGSAKEDGSCGLLVGGPAAERTDGVNIPPEHAS